VGAESPRKMSWILLSCLLEFAGHAMAFGVMNGMCGILWMGKELYEIIFVAEEFPVFEIPAKIPN
jgi:hypothetical protein